MNERILIEKIGETKIDKIELSNGVINEIKNMHDLMEKEILIDNSKLNKYVTTNGETFSYLHVKRCNEGGMLPSEAEVRKHGEELNKVWQSLRRYLQRRA